MFDIILDFLKNYYREIITMISAIVCLILFIVRKKPSMNIIDEVKVLVSEHLPEFILAAENTKMSGPDKLDLVVNLSLFFIGKSLKRSLKEDEASYFKTFVIDEVEKILATPQKKGD